MLYWIASSFASAALAVASGVAYGASMFGATLLLGEPITNESTVALGLLLAGVGTTALLAWRAARWVYRVERLEENLRRAGAAIDRLRAILEKMRRESEDNDRQP